MARVSRLLDRVLLRRMKAYCTRKLAQVETLGADEAAHLHRSLQPLKQRFDRLFVASAERLSGGTSGVAKIVSPARTEWAMRPAPWRARLSPSRHVSPASGLNISDGVALYHDDPEAQVIIAQRPPTPSGAGLVYGLEVEVFDFSGSYVSLALSLPYVAVKEVGKSDLIGLQLGLSNEIPVEVFARLNVRHGPNTEKVSRHVDITSGSPNVEFDLFYTDIEERLITDIWVDLIIEKPFMNKITIDDLTLSRRPRASV